MCELTEPSELLVLWKFPRMKLPQHAQQVQNIPSPQTLRQYSLTFWSLLFLWLQVRGALVWVSGCSLRLLVAVFLPAHRPHHTSPLEAGKRHTICFAELPTARRMWTFHVWRQTVTAPLRRTESRKAWTKPRQITADGVLSQPVWGFCVSTCFIYSVPVLFLFL